MSNRLLCAAPCGVAALRKLFAFNPIKENNNNFGRLPIVWKVRLGIPHLILIVTLLVGAAPSAAWACACGCSVFDVGFNGLPQEVDHGGRVFYEFDRSNQTQNWIGHSRADASLNNDKNVNMRTPQQ